MKKFYIGVLSLFLFGIGAFGNWYLITTKAEDTLVWSCVLAYVASHMVWLPAMWWWGKHVEQVFTKKEEEKP